MRTVVYGVPHFEVLRWTLTNIVTFGSVDARNFFSVFNLFAVVSVLGAVTS